MINVNEGGFFYTPQISIAAASSSNKAVIHKTSFFEGVSIGKTVIVFWTQPTGCSNEKLAGVNTLVAKETILKKFKVLSIIHFCLDNYSFSQDSFLIHIIYTKFLICFFLK